MNETNNFYTRTTYGHEEYVDSLVGIMPENHDLEVAYTSFLSSLNYERSELRIVDESLNFKEFINLINGIAGLTNMVLNGGYDAIIFLDKSARVLHYPLRSAISSANVSSDFRYPKVRYINIGTERSPKYTENVQIESIRDYVGYTNPFIESESKALVVDELVGSGGTLTTARLVLKHAFPNVELEFTGVFGLRPFWTRNSKYAGVIDKADIYLNSGQSGFSTITPSEHYECISRAATDIKTSRPKGFIGSGFKLRSERYKREANLRSYRDLLENRDLGSEIILRRNIRKALSGLGRFVGNKYFSK